MPTTEIEFTGEQLENYFHAALKAGDIKGVECALTVMCAVDPHRAIRLHKATQDALTIANFLNGRATDG